MALDKSAFLSYVADMENLPTLEQLGHSIRLHLSARHIGLRELERETGISRATLSRATRGMEMCASHYIVLAEKYWGENIFSKKAG